MKKYRIALYALLSGLTLLTGCQKELMDYEGKDCLYFDVRRGASWLTPSTWPHYTYTAVEFGNLAENELTATYRVMASGAPKDYDRPFTVTVNKDSTTVATGSEYYKLQTEDYVIKAGEISAYVTVELYRTEQMNGDTLQLQLQLHENNSFELKYTTYADPSYYYSPTENKKFDYNTNAGIHNIFLFDVLSRPGIWWGNDESGMGQFGKYSAKKYRLMMQLSNTTVQDYQKGSTTMPGSRIGAIAELMAKHLLEQARAKTPVLDEDGTMMFFGPIESIGGSDAWKPFTKSEDYYK